LNVKIENINFSLTDATEPTTVLINACFNGVYFLL